MEPTIIFEDDYILVLDKPAGMIVNVSDTTAGERTIQEWVEEYLQILNPKFQILNKSKIQNSNVKNVPPSPTPSPSRGEGRGEGEVSNLEFLNRAGIVHRLDKETSGILVVAKTPKAFENLQKQFKERQVKKTYIALVHGKVEPNEGEINVPVGRLPWNRKRFGVVSGGREAVTRYRVLRIKLYKRHSGKPRLAGRIQNLPRERVAAARDSGQARMTGKEESLSLLELYPQTGRTHQIRVHLKYFNHPLFSDSLYGGRKTARNDRKLLSRIFLHASKISFYHPNNGQIVSFESPLPEELNQFLKTFNS
ncbi:MAG: RluA family pseudouridine synthase [Patescibacteria group bacterium]